MTDPDALRPVPFAALDWREAYPLRVSILFGDSVIPREFMPVIMGACRNGKYYWRKIYKKPRR